MIIDSCLIKSAGLGTRMGLIGRQLPKVLWPVYEKTLLELQIELAQSLGVKKIFINTHFLHEEIAKFVESKKFKNVVLLHEKELLGSGGCVHNILEHDKTQERARLLILNGDSFLFHRHKDWSHILDSLPNEKVILFGITVNGESGYNEIVTTNQYLSEIQKAGQRKEYQTFSGISIVDLKSLTQKSGPSSFFNTVANYKSSNCYVYELEEYEFWDFGTADLYYSSLFKILELRDGPFVKFCKKYGAFEGESFSDNNGYNSSGQESIINLSGKSLKALYPKNSIILSQEEGNKGVQLKEQGLYYDSIFQRQEFTQCLQKR